MLYLNTNLHLTVTQTPMSQLSLLGQALRKGLGWCFSLRFHCVFISFQYYKFEYPLSRFFFMLRVPTVFGTGFGQPSIQKAIEQDSDFYGHLLRKKRDMAQPDFQPLLANYSLVRMDTGVENHRLTDSDSVLERNGNRENNIVHWLLLFIILFKIFYVCEIKEYK